MFQRLMQTPLTKKHNSLLTRPVNQRWSSLSSLSSSPYVIGLLKETYNRWERRTPLTPNHVATLLKTNQGNLKVIVQPSAKRIYTDEAFAKAGATLTEDISSAHLLLGIKQVEPSSLVPHATYGFFSHVIKGQLKNMPLLDEILKQDIRLIDYECIRSQGHKTGQRRVAFGTFAGMAGMINTFRGIGERSLMQGYSTPFLNIGSTYMYPNSEVAKYAVKQAGEEIRKHGIPQALAPMTFVFTGNGNVATGAREVFECMPHEWVKPSALPFLPTRTDVLYGCLVDASDMVEKRGSVHTKDDRDQKDWGVPFDKKDYYLHPETYQACFHRTILPHTSVLVNCMYWDDRYPRLISKGQVKDLYQQQRPGGAKLIGVGDITCDIGGSIEFLEKSTDIERPFFLYDPLSDKVNDSLRGTGVMMMGVDILPSELPQEASMHFGDTLLPYIQSLIHGEVSVELEGATIAEKGGLKPGYQYIQKMRAQRERSVAQREVKSLQETAGSTCLLLKGHLFDTGLINRVLNVIEEHGGNFYMVDCQVYPNDATRSMSLVTLQISLSTKEEKEKVIQALRSMCTLSPEAEASITLLPDFCEGDYSKTLLSTANKTRSLTTSLAPPHAATPAVVGEGEPILVFSKDRRQITCLGAGLVAAPLVEYLSRDPLNHVLVASSLDGQARAMANKMERSNVQGIFVDARKDPTTLDELCQASDCIVSLLPATMHVDIAKRCLGYATPLVTASYVSPDMKKLEDWAKRVGVPILCEMGLDPGMDHMSAMKVIQEVQDRGGSVESFSSVCGGLPAPEAANNPFRYKFSWSPLGVLTAAQNPSTYRKNGKLVEVSGDQLLSQSELTRFFPSLALEQLPNRNCIPYGDIYGIASAKSLFRGTLRYAGWSSIMHQCKQLGLLDPTTCTLPATWSELIHSLPVDDVISTLSEDAHDALHWLGVFSSKPVAPQGSRLGAFCALLEEKLQFQPGERDMAVMHHIFGVVYPDGKRETRTSTFIGFGEPNGDTIMARTVGITAAIGAKLILEKRLLQTSGVLLPTTPDVYLPGLALLEAEGMHFTETTIHPPLEKKNQSKAR